MPRLILVRHGETDWNVEGRWQGQKDVALNDLGREQAALAGAYLRSQFDIQKLWSSDLKRCVATAEAVGLPVIKSKLLRELSYGDWEGRRFAELSEAEKKDAAERLAWEPGWNAPGGEMLEDMIRRGKRFLAESGVLEEDGDIVIVSHGGTMRGLIVTLLGLPDSAIGKFGFSNSGISVVAVDGKQTALLAHNITAHLDAAHPRP
jgi:broad specificity phosphatase PhoE